jgi:hypothetical protein
MVGDIVTLTNYNVTSVFFFLFQYFFLFLCTLVTLWLANITNVINHNVTQVFSVLIYVCSSVKILHLFGIDVRHFACVTF